MAPREPTFWEKLYLVPHVFRLVFVAFSRVLLRPITSGPRPKYLGKDVVFAVIRSHVSNLSNGLEQWLLPSTEQIYLKFAKQKGFQPDTDVLESGAKLHWLGSKSTDKIFYFIHGGGYSLPLDDGHVKWAFDLQNDVSKDEDATCVLLNYTLAPTAQYPYQLQQAADGLAHLLKIGKKASNIVIGGDSAGGNASVMVLSHILHPHPDTIKITLDEPLAGALLISPWTSFHVDDTIAHRNANNDLVTTTVAKRWSSAFLGKSPEDNYNVANNAPADWFNGLEKAVKEIFIWCGGGELLVDDVQRLHKKLQQAHSSIEYVEEPGAAHIDMIMDVALNYEKGEGTKAIEKWIGRTLQGDFLK